MKFFLQLTNQNLHASYVAPIWLKNLLKYYHVLVKHVLFVKENPAHLSVHFNNETITCVNAINWHDVIAREVRIKIDTYENESAAIPSRTTLSNFAKCIRCNILSMIDK